MGEEGGKEDRWRIADGCRQAKEGGGEEGSKVEGSNGRWWG